MKKVLLFLCFTLSAYTNQDEVSWKSPTTLSAKESYESLVQWLFSQKVVSYSLSTAQTIGPILHLPKILPEFAENHRYDSKERPLIGKVTKAREDLLPTLGLLEEISWSTLSGPSLMLVTAEILAKVLAYRNLELGDLIAIPCQTSSSKRDLVSYRIDHIFNLWSGMPAFGLLPMDEGKREALLLFRGTSVSLSNRASLASMLSDFDPKGPGLSVYFKARKELRTWMQSAYENGRKTRAIGYSLGGAFVEYLSIFDFDLLTTNPLAPSVAFNQPGVSKTLLEKWDEIPESLKPAFLCFVVKGDVISKVGSLFGAASQLSLPKALTPIQAHTNLMLAHPLCQIDDIDIIKENKSPLRTLQK